MLALSLGLAACGTLDPTDDGEPEATRTEPVEDADDSAAALTVGDGTFNFSITDCFATEEGVRFTGRSPDGDTISGEFDAEAPDDASIVITDQEGTQLYTSDESSGDAAPRFQMTDDGGFTATGTFVSDTDEAEEGSLTGAC